MHCRLVSHPLFKQLSIQDPRLRCKVLPVARVPHFQTPPPKRNPDQKETTDPLPARPFFEAKVLLAWESSVPKPKQNEMAMAGKISLHKLVVLGDGGVGKTALTIQVRCSLFFVCLA